MPKIKKSDLDRLIELHERDAHSEWFDWAYKTFGEDTPYFGVDCILNGVNLVRCKHTKKKETYYKVFEALGYEITEE